MNKKPKYRFFFYKELNTTVSMMKAGAPWWREC